MRVRLLLLLLIKIRLVSACQPGQLVYGTRANRAAELVYILREVRPDDDGYGALFELEWLAEPALCSDTKFIESCTGCRDNCFRKASDLQQVCDSPTCPMCKEVATAAPHRPWVVGRTEAQDNFGTVFALILGVFGCFVILFILCPAFMRNGDSEQAEGVVRKPNIPVPAYRAGSSGLWPSGAAAEQESEPGEDPSKEHGSINKDHGGRNNHPGRKRPRGLVDVDASFVWTPKIAPSPKGSSFSPKQAGARMMSALSPKTTKIITSLSSPKNALGGEKTRPGSSTKNPFNHLMSVLIHGEHRAVADGPADGGDDHALTARDRAIRQKVLRQKLARPLSRATLAARQAEAAEREAAAVSRRTTEEDPRDNPALPPPERRAPVTGDEGRADYHRVSEQPTGSPFPPDRAGSKRTSARRGSSERGLPQRESYREVRDRLKRPTPQAPKEPSKSIAEIMLEAEKRALSPVDLPVEGDWTPPEGSKGVIVTRTPTEIVITPRL